MGAIQAMFILANDPNAPTTCFDGLLMLGYDTTFTKLVLIAFFPDFDVVSEVALANPGIYKELKSKSSLLLSVRSVGLNFIVTLFQSVIIFYLPEITFSAC